MPGIDAQTELIKIRELLDPLAKLWTITPVYGDATMIPSAPWQVVDGTIVTVYAAYATGVGLYLDGVEIQHSDPNASWVQVGGLWVAVTYTFTARANHVVQALV